MGAFKPLLPFGPVTVVEACVRYLLEGGAASVMVVTGHRGDEVRQSLTHLPVSFAVNPEVESEMGRSIACGVAELPPGTEAVMIALVDQPAIPPSVPQALIRAWRGSSRAQLLAPEHGGRGGHPVLVDARLSEELLRLDAIGGLRALFHERRERVLRVAVESPYIARDMDTWDDYSALYQEVFGARPPLNSPA